MTTVKQKIGSCQLVALEIHEKFLDALPSASVPITVLQDKAEPLRLDDQAILCAEWRSIVSGDIYNKIAAGRKNKQQQQQQQQKSGGGGGGGRAGVGGSSASKASEPQKKMASTSSSSSASGKSPPGKSPVTEGPEPLHSFTRSCAHPILARHTLNCSWVH
jgi:hypothetical protein